MPNCHFFSAEVNHERFILQQAALQAMKIKVACGHLQTPLPKIEVDAVIQMLAEGGETLFQFITKEERFLSFSSQQNLHRNLLHFFHEIMEAWEPPLPEADRRDEWTIFNPESNQAILLDFANSILKFLDQNPPKLPKFANNPKMQIWLQLVEMRGMIKVIQKHFDTPEAPADGWVSLWGFSLWDKLVVIREELERNIIPLSPQSSTHISLDWIWADENFQYKTLRDGFNASFTHPSCRDDNLAIIWHLIRRLLFWLKHKESNWEVPPPWGLRHRFHQRAKPPKQI